MDNSIVEFEKTVIDYIKNSTPHRNHSNIFCRQLKFIYNLAEEKEVTDEEFVDLINFLLINQVFLLVGRIPQISKSTRVIIRRLLPVLTAKDLGSSIWERPFHENLKECITHPTLYIAKHSFPKRLAKVHYEAVGNDYYEIKPHPDKNLMQEFLNSSVKYKKIPEKLGRIQTQ